MEHAVAFMIGISALTLGVSFMVRWRDWVGLVREIRERGRPASLVIGYLHLFLGTFIVSFHWKWHGLPLLLTLIGVKGIVEGCIYMLFPGVVPAIMKWYGLHARALFSISGLLTVIIALVVLDEWQHIAKWGDVWHPNFNETAFIED
jgi:MFS family permease